MSSTDALIQTLTDAHTRLDETRVWEAYAALTGQIVGCLTRKPYTTQGALTSTEIVFIRHGLRTLSPQTRAELIASGAALRQVLNRTTPQPTTAPPPKPPPPAAQAAPIDEKPAAPNIHEVYLVATRRDGALLRRLHAELTAADLRVWTDTGLRPGSAEWRAAVEEAMKGCGAVVVLLTPEAKENRWVEQQLHYALALNRSIFPLLARGEPKDSLPSILGDQPVADIRREPTYRTTMRRLKRALMAFR